jgi:2-polyprenyl-3-methyl-5-hydroxy-6-metoxy-1,4-benzoquinol methylase
MPGGFWMSAAEAILVGSIDSQELREALGSCHQKFDCILLLDVLEHLVDPWETLEFVKSQLNRDGRLILSLPNVASLKVLYPLLFLDQFRYADSGILDKTHLRFFTRTETLKMVQEAGFRLIVIRSSGATAFHQVRSFKGLAAYLVNTLTFRLLERFIAHQWILLATPET